MLALEARRTRRWEAAIMMRADHLVTLTERDRDIACALSGRRDVTVRYPTTSATTDDLRHARGPVKPGSVVFVGQMSRRENEDAAVWFIDSVWPEVVRACPHARLTIAGADPSPQLYRRQNAHVSVTGYIENISEVLGTAALSVAPLRMGSGIKMKVVQSIEAGVPTVATPVGAEGVRPSPLLHVADTVGSFASTCIRLLK
jgi:glycosyltransferase involved in cell wall biosynthesis